MRLRSTIFFTVLLFSVNAWSQTISTGNGSEQISTASVTGQGVAKKITLSSPSSETLVEMGRDPSLDAGTTLQFYTFNTYAGLLELESANIVPSWLVEEVLTDNNVTRADLTGDMLNKVFLQESIDAEGLQLLIQRKEYERLHPELDGLCGGKWYNHSKSFGDSLTKSIEKSATAPTVNKNFTLSSNFKGNSSTKLKIDYQTRENKCIRIPYRVRAKKVTLDFLLTVSEQTSSAAFSYTPPMVDVITPQHLNLWGIDGGFWVWIFYIDYEFDLSLDYGATLATNVTLSATSKSGISGTIHKQWVCTADSCDRTDLPDDKGLIMADPSFVTAMQGDIKFTPYVDLNLTGHIGLYKLDFATFADAKLGIRAEVPIRYFFYSGNGCSDADNDGKFETINSQLIDITAYASAYFKYSGVVGKGYSSIDLKVAGWQLISPQYWQTGDSSPKQLNDRVYRKNIYFQEFGDKKIFDPVLTPSKPFAAKGSTLTVSKRSCYSLDTEPTYLIDWGDNSSDETKAGAIPHTYSGLGVRTVIGKPLRDEAGRTFDNSAEGTRLNLNVTSGTQTTDFSAWLIPVINLLLL